ncbi:MAG: exopolyphosphatase [Acidimicrobiales bacterium]
MTNGEEPPGPVAAIDCGTNSTRLLIADTDGKTLERVNRITRLGVGVDRNGRLDPEAIDRTVKVLGVYRGLLDRHRVRAMRVTATSAARDAANRDEFFDAAESALGARPELLDGSEEGRLSFAGALLGLGAVQGPVLVVDIGGGSTELVVGSDVHAGPTGVYSMDVGCVRLTERFLVSDPPTADELEAAKLYVHRQIDAALLEVPQLSQANAMIGLAGTVACMAATDQGIDGTERHRLHHYALCRSAVERIRSTLAAMTADQRRSVPGVEDGRADVIVGGAVVLGEVMARFGFDVCLTSEADILDGLAASIRC